MTNRRKRRKSRAKHSTGPPRGAYPLPSGGYVTESVGPPDRRGRRIRIRAVHRDQPDAAMVAQALIALVIERAQAEDRTHNRAGH
jgi:hypothetical protein